MSTMSLAVQRSNSVITAAYEHSLRLKAAGIIDVSPALGTMFGEMRDQTANRERYSLFRGWLYAAVNALASEAAGQPVVVAKLKGAEEKPKLKKSLDQYRRKMPTNTRIKTTKQEFEVLVDHELTELLETPNPIQNRWQFVYNFVASLNLTGWAYVVGGENEEGEFEFYCVPTTWVTPDHKEGPFSRFKIVDPSSPSSAPDEKDWLTRENVAFAMLPNPADPRCALAPAQSQIQAIRIDDYIQSSQEQFFDNGIFPGAIVTIGKDPHPDVPGGMRPRLTAAQRRQVMGAIRKVMAGVANYGNPAIVDGMIESIERLSMTSNEMGWERSEQTARTRLLSAYGVHPYILGEPVGVGGYAQVVNIEKRFYKRVNTFLDMLSAVISSFVGKAVGKETEENLLVWWEECQAVDPGLRWSNLNAARTRGDVSRNEIRVELGLPPDETGGEATKNYTAGDVNAIIAVQTASGQGVITIDQAAAIYEAAFDMSPEDAKRLAGKPLATPLPIPGAGGQASTAPGEKPTKPKTPPTEEEAVSTATEELKKAVSALGISVVGAGLPSVVADRLIEMVKFNPNHGADGRFSSGSGGPLMAADDGGANVSVGGGGGSSQWERLRDREEGTQAEADREVRRADKAVMKARQELDVAKAKMAAHEEARAAGLKSIETFFEGKLSEINARRQQLQQEQEAGAKRMAELKAKLAGMRKLPKRRSADNEELTLAKIAAAWDDEIKNLENIVEGFEAMADACERLARKVHSDLVKLGQ